MRRWRLSLELRRWRVGRPLGWAETLSPRGPGMGFPLGCGSSLGLGWVTGQSRMKNSTSVLFGSRGSCHIWEGTPLTTLRDILSPAPALISAMLLADMADMSQGGGEGRRRERASPSLAGPRNDRVKGVGVGEGRARRNGRRSTLECLRMSLRGWIPALVRPD